MKAVQFPGDGTTVLTEVPDPVAGPGEVVVEIRASGMCGSDLHMRNGSLVAGEVVQGHEPCGVVASVGAGVLPQVARVGDRVMIHHYVGCTACPSCRSGWPQLCESAPAKVMGQTIDGGHAPFIKVPAQTLLPLPDALSFKAGAAVGCGTGTAWGGLRRLGDIAGQTLVVFGQGPVGLSGTMFAAALGADVIAVDIDPVRLARAESFGARAVINSAEEDLPSRLEELTGSPTVPLVLETSGRANADALRVLGTWGRVCFLGLPGHVEFDVQQQYKKQWTLLTSWTMSSIEQQRCAEFIAAHDLPIDDIFTRSWSLDQAAEAYDWFAGHADGKGVFEF
ncbi:alcohol dehydrogenase catalytic domain-containing protein [Tsukamurella sp. NPDC003166]|uniref:alcohol dehydrogenase catalytic domain-containing protein n=1 Tax=Tsukamurella sp. NPDC003166 TaxID=3154444 RepID=UPI0033B98725